MEVNFVGGDRAPCITNAATAVWPESKRLLCWPHLKLSGLPKHKDKLNNPNFFEEAQTDILRMHESQNFHQFQFIQKLVINKWKKKKEDRLIDWFESQYLRPPHDKFFYTASGYPLIIPNQNPEERFNKSLKGGGFSKWEGGTQTLTVFCNDTIAEQLKNLSIDLGTEPIFLTAQGRPSRFVLQKAQALFYSDDRFSFFIYI